MKGKEDWKDKSEEDEEGLKFVTGAIKKAGEG